MGLELNSLRLNSRHALRNTPAHDRYAYAKGRDNSSGTGHTGYFAGCMTLLSPRILRAMESIFAAAGEEVWWADRSGGVCCGRPLKLSGEVDAAREMMKINAEMFIARGLTTLVTSCPICLKVFREDYVLPGIEVLHHSEYIERLLREGRIELTPGAELFTYHDPCELGRGCGIYEPPREIVRRVGTLVEPAETGLDALCCGSSIAGNGLDRNAVARMGAAVGRAFEQTGAGSVVTACPLCKKAIARGTSLHVADIAEVVERHLAAVK